MAKKAGKSTGEHEHTWVRLVYGLPTAAALDAAKAGRVVLAHADRRGGEPQQACVGCGARA